VTKLKALLLVVGLAAFVLAGASFQHLHASGEFGLWNEEHDLALMATFGADTSHLDVTPVVAPALILVATLVFTASLLGGAPLHHADSRAPPVP
jgi:hypothetical protein